MRPFDSLRLIAVHLLPAGMILLAAGGVFAKPVPDDPAAMPQPVAHWLIQAKQDCPAGFQSQHAVESVSLTGDGRPGFIADPHRLSCAGEPHLFSGDGPASIELFVTLPSGEVVHTGGVLALTYQVLPSPQGGAPTLAFQTHETAERSGSLDSYRWDGQNFALLTKQSLAPPPVGGPDAEFQK